MQKRKNIQLRNRQFHNYVFSKMADGNCLWIFMRKRKLHEAIRTSLENFGQFDHYDLEDELEQRHVDIIPLYALSNLN